MTEHVHFSTDSLISARLCTSCGSYVSNNAVSDHRAFHQRIDALEKAAGLGDDLQLDLIIDAEIEDEPRTQ